MPLVTTPKKVVPNGSLSYNITTLTPGRVIWSTGDLLISSLKPVRILLSRTLTNTNIEETKYKQVVGALSSET